MLKAPTSIPSTPMNAQPSSAEKGPPRFESSQSDLTQSTGVNFTESLEQLDQNWVAKDVQEIRSTASTITTSPSATIRRHTRSSSTLAQFFAAGSFFSPPCSRVGLVSSSPFAKGATLSIGHAPQVQVGAERNLEVCAQTQQMVSGRRRTLSNLNTELQNPSQDQPQPSVRSLLRPILTLVTVSTATAGISDDDPLRTDSGCEDLPSPIYGRYDDGEYTGGGFGGKGLHYAVETDAVELFEPSREVQVSTTLDKDKSVERSDIRSLSTSNLMVLESGLQRKVGAIASSGAVIDTPLMNLQEQGYVVVRSRGFDGPTSAELSVVTTCGRAEGVHDDESSMVMSASLEERYWQTSVSLENLADIRQPSSPDTAEGSVMDVLNANTDTQDSIFASNLMITVPDAGISAGDECLQTAYAVEAHGPIRDKDLRKRLRNTGVLKLDLDLDLKQETIQGDTAWHAKQGHDNIGSGGFHQDWSCGARHTENSLPQSLVVQGPVLNARALVPLPESPVTAVDDEYAKFTPFYYLPSLPPSPELDTASSFEEHEEQCASGAGMCLLLLPPLPLSPVMDPTQAQCTFATDCIPLAMLPPLPPSPELPSKPLSINTGPELLLLPPLPPSPTEAVCTPKSLEIASTKAQLRYWSQTAARLRDQEQILTARIDVLIQEMAQVLDKCQETELGLLANETVVHELRQELIKEQEFGFASVQEAALSIHEKCLLETALEESWKELGVLREAWVHPQQGPEVSLPKEPSTVSAFANVDNTIKQIPIANENSSPSERSSSQALVYSSAQKRPTHSTFFHSLVKLLCLALICTMALVSMAVLLYGQQYHLHQVYQTLLEHASRWRFDTKYAYRQFEAVAEEVSSHIQVLLQRQQKTAENHVHSMTELFWTAVELGADMDMAELWQSLQISRTWS